MTIPTDSSTPVPASPSSGVTRRQVLALGVAAVAGGAPFIARRQPSG